MAQAASAVRDHAHDHTPASNPAAQPAVSTTAAPFAQPEQQLAVPRDDSDADTVATNAISDLMFFNPGGGAFARSTSHLSDDSTGMLSQRASLREGSYAALHLSGDGARKPSLRGLRLNRSQRRSATNTSAEIATAPLPARGVPQSSPASGSTGLAPHATQFQAERCGHEGRAQSVPVANAPSMEVPAPLVDTLSEAEQQRQVSWLSWQQSLSPAPPPRPGPDEVSGSATVSVALDSSALRSSAPHESLRHLRRKRGKPDKGVLRPERTTTIRSQNGVHACSLQRACFV